MAEEHVDYLGDVCEPPDVADGVDEIEPEECVCQTVESGHLLGGLKGDVEVGLAEAVGAVEQEVVGGLVVASAVPAPVNRFFGTNYEVVRFA